MKIVIQPLIGLVAALPVFYLFGGRKTFFEETAFFTILLAWFELGLLHAGIYIGGMKERFSYFAVDSKIIVFGFLFPPIALLALPFSFGYTKKLSLKPYTDRERYHNFQKEYRALSCTFQEFLQRYPSDLSRTNTQGR